MNLTKLIPILLPCILATSISPNAMAQSRYADAISVVSDTNSRTLDLKLQKALGQLLKEINDSVIENKDQIERNQIVHDEILKQIGSLKISSCQVELWLKEHEHHSNQSAPVLNYVLDRVNEYQERVEEFETSFSEIIGADAKDDDRLREEIRKLSSDVATTQTSMTTIKMNVIPQIRENIEKNKQDISSELALVRLALSEYKSQHASICTKLNTHDRRLAELERRFESQQSRIAAADKIRKTRETTLRKSRGLPVPRVDSEPPVIASPRRATVSLPVIHPQQIVPIHQAKSFVCPNAQLIRKCYDYRVVDVTYGIRQVMDYHGDLYTCSGRYVLVTHRKGH